MTASKPLSVPPATPQTSSATPPDADGRPSNIVQLKDIEVVFTTRKGAFRVGKVRAINGISLDLPRGKTVALVGESGSGKTTTGRVSLRLVRPTAGKVIFDGQDITNIPSEKLGWFRRRAQIVFQDPFSSLNPYMRVHDLVAEPLLIDGDHDHHERDARVAAALEAVDLVPPAVYGPKYPTMMSGGQRQRVGIARALVRDPEYIVADEPVSMIDASSRIGILDLLRNLQVTRGVSFLYITHDLASARHFSDQINVMYLGTIVERGTADAVIDRPLHPYTKALIAAVPEPDPKNRLHLRPVVPGEQATGGKFPTGCPFHTRCPKFMSGVCDVVRPVLKEQEPGHWVACHLYE